MTDRSQGPAAKRDSQRRADQRESAAAAGNAQADRCGNQRARRRERKSVNAKASSMRWRPVDFGSVLHLAERVTEAVSRLSFSAKLFSQNGEFKEARQGQLAS